MDEPRLDGILALHHFGCVVRDLARAAQFYARLGYQCSAPVQDPGQQAELVLCSAPGRPTLELVRPLDPAAPVAAVLKRENETLYHTCYEVEDLETALAALRTTHRVLLIRAPLPAPLFGGRAVAFYYVAGVGLCEFLVRQGPAGG